MDWGRLSERHLQSFWMTVTVGSVRGAADRLNVEPSVISRHLQRLQSQLGVRLLERRGRGVKPTEAASVLVEFCELRRAQEEQLMMRLGDMGKTLRGRVHIVAGEGFLPDLMAWSLCEFGRQHPSVDITLEQAGVGEVVRMVAQDKAHIGIAYCIEPSPPVEAVVSRRKPVCMIVAPGHPLAKANRPVSLREAARYPIAQMATGFGLQQAVSRAADAAKVHITDRLVTNSLTSLREFAALGLGVSFMSAQSAAAEVSAGRLVVLPTTSRVLNGMRVHVLVRSGRLHSRAVKEVIGFLARKSAIWEVAP
ncbi:LysR family transcriptional regulator [Bradyrhizobium sp. BR 10289]|uniref:LysR family transcriptional regulator n=1 Tax=Bradyrhizobium sp. BR 10289 TaxID=2749993 RepID=UPI001C64E26A|nr:LysR family transcriptional regulator [Bradyrhizobium sp. BR 10289]MBW7970220.1 LysR family transcriptional regulator [Bradyrhizobium sp. BR 10289]